MECRVQLNAIASSIPGPCNEVVENPGSNTATAMSFVHHHFVDVTDESFVPQVALDGQRTEANDVPVFISTKVNLPGGQKSAREDSVERCRIQNFFRPKLTQEGYDGRKVIAIA